MIRDVEESLISSSSSSRVDSDGVGKDFRKVLQAYTKPSRFNFHYLRIIQARPTVRVIRLILHNALYYGVGIVTCHDDYDMVRANWFDRWRLGAIGQ